MPYDVSDRIDDEALELLAVVEAALWHGESPVSVDVLRLIRSTFPATGPDDIQPCLARLEAAGVIENIGRGGPYLTTGRGDLPIHRRIAREGVLLEVVRNGRWWPTLVALNLIAASAASADDCQLVPKVAGALRGSLLQEIKRLWRFHPAQLVPGTWPPIILGDKAMGIILTSGPVDTAIRQRFEAIDYMTEFERYVDMGGPMPTLLTSAEVEWLKEVTNQSKGSDLCQVSP